MEREWPPTALGAQVSTTGPGGQQAVSNGLGGVQVLFDGIPAPLLYAGPAQSTLSCRGKSAAGKLRRSRL